MNKPRKNKFLLVGTSAVLVASAFAPVAMAKSFKDVPTSNSHFVGIDALSDQKIISGYQDGTFKPNRQLSRSDVVKMMGKYLVEVEGKSIPSDYKTKMRFKDLRSTSQDELLKYAALVYDEGLFQGSNGNLMYQNAISRQNMAVVLARLISKKYAIADLGDLMDFASKNGGTIEVTDLNAAFADYRDEIELLDLLAITNVQKFNPSGTVTRGQFASFLYRTLENNYINKYEVNKSVPLDKTAVSADGKTISFKGVLAGTNIKVYNGSDTKLGEGTAGSDGNLTIALNPALKPTDTVKLQVTLPNGEVVWCEFPPGEWSLGGELMPGDNTNPNPNPNPGEAEGLQGLKDLIAKANGAKVVVSDDGTDVSAADKWTTQAALTALEERISNADAVSKKDGVTTAEVAAATSSLQTALNAYENAKQFGKKADLVDLNALINTANESIVAVSTNGADIEATKKWTTQDVLTAFQDKIAEAQTTASKPNVTNEEVAEAITKLQAAITTYDAAKKDGQKPDGSTLTSLIASAKSTKVSTSADGKDIPQNEQWTTEAVLQTFDAAISVAESVNSNPTSTIADVQAAQTTLTNAINAYNGAKLFGTQQVLLAQRSISNVGLKTAETQFNQPIGGTALNTPALSFNLLQLQLGSQIGGDVLGTNPGVPFTVPAGSELSFSFRATLSTILGLGAVDLGVYKKSPNGDLTRVWLDGFEYLSAVGAPLQNKYNFSVEGLTEGDYVLLAGPKNGVALNLIGGMAIVFTESALDNKSSSINTSLSSRSTSGQVVFNNDAKITKVTPAGKNAVSNVAAPIDGTHGRLSINANTGEYTYTSFGNPSSVGKVDVFEYEVTRGTQAKTNHIYIRHNAVDGSTTIPLKWDDANPTSDAVASTLTAQVKNVMPTQGADVTVTIPAANRSYDTNGITTENFFITDTSSVLTFNPFNELGNTTKYELYPAGNVTVPVKSETFNFSGAVVGTEQVSWTGIPRGEYVIQATRISGGVAFGIRNIRLVNKPFVASDITGQLFSSNASVDTNATSYVAPGTMVLVDGVIVTDETKVQGEYGELTVRRNGTYTYKTTNQNKDFAINPPEVFDVEVHHADGTVKKTTLTIRFGNSSAYVPSTFYSLSDAPAAVTIDYKG